MEVDEMRTSKLLVFVIIATACLAIVHAQEDPGRSGAKLLYDKGYQLFIQAKWKQAIENFNKAVASDSTFSLAWCYKGSSLLQLEQYSEALEAFDSALTIQSESIYAFS